MADYEQREPKLKPPGKMAKEEVQEFFRCKVAYETSDRCRDASRWRRAELYDEGNQQLRPAFTHAGAGAPAQWIALQYNPSDPLSVPRPVFNEGLPIRQNESARLARPEYKPFVRPSGENPDIKVKLGAQKAKDVLLSELQRMEWDKEEDLFFWGLPTYGGSWVLSWWDQPWTEVVNVPVDTAMACPNRRPLESSPIPGPDGEMIQPPPSEPCEFRLAKPEVSAQEARQDPYLSDLLAEKSFAAPAPSLHVSTCATCPDHPPLEKFQPTIEEADGKDSLGRPMGEPQPLGQWALKCRSPFDVFPENGGIDIDYANQREITLSHVESLDWIAERWPDKAKDVKPENPAALMEFHPVAGAPDIYTTGASSKLFTCHARVKEHHKKPWMEFDPEAQSYRMNRGRSLIMASDVVLLDGEYLIKSVNDPKKSVERVWWEYVPFEFREGGRRLAGLGLWDSMFDAQDNVNETASQRQAINRRMAVPTWVKRRGWNSEIGTMDGMPGRQWEIDTDPLAPNEIPQIVNNDTAPQGLTQEGEASLAYMNRVGARSELESGRVPNANLSAATAIAQLLEESAEGRKPRIRRIRNAFRRLWSHGLRLVSGMWIEPRQYKSEGEDGEERWEALKGLDLQGQTDVDLEPIPISDSPDIKRENVRDLIQLQVIRPGTDPVLDRKIAKALDAPSEFHQDEDLQESAAQREWVEFIQQGKPPCEDPSLDDPMAHYQEHGRACHKESFRDLEERAGWNDALDKVLAGDWDEFLKFVAFLPQMQRQLQQAQEAEVAKQAMSMGQPPPPPNMAPPMPVPALQVRIKQAWTERLLGAGWQSPDPEALEQVLSWRAHIEAHRLRLEMKQMQAMAAPTAAAPGAEATEAGTQVTAGQPADAGAAA